MMKFCDDERFKLQVLHKSLKQVSQIKFYSIISLVNCEVDKTFGQSGLKA